MIGTRWISKLSNVDELFTSVRIQKFAEGKSMSILTT